MGNLLVDERDVAFVLFEQLKVGELCSRPPFSELSQDVFEMALKEAQKLAVNEIMPTNVLSDREGCVKDGNQVRVPKAFHKIWRLYIDGGWMTISEPPEVGGQGMPAVVAAACNEFCVAANTSFVALPGLTRGAARLINAFGTEAQKKKYMHKMFAGEWAGTMCLTEPQAGSDVGAIKTTARRNPDGTFSITGTKMFITNGDHDLTENIVHPVLARIEGAPAGTKGISLFLVPKYRVNEDGSLGAFNDVVVAGLEHKMGFHGSPTCLLNFGEEGGCIGELLGEENQGMKIMFQLMNEARIGVGLQGLAVASTAYLHALRYAKERLQGSDIREFRNPEAPRVPIIRHPDVRRMLLYMKSLVEGIRGMIYFCAYCEDRVRCAADDAERQKYRGFVEMLTPVVKAYSTDMSFRITETAIQVYGGYGYIKEYPVEQFLRDTKISSIYEGTNGIQALDLVARKLGMGKGMVLMSFLGEVSQFIEAAKGSEGLKPAVEKLEASKNAVAEVAMFFASKAREDFILPVLYACPFLDLFGDMIVGWQLLWQAKIAQEKLEAIYEQKNASSPQERETVVTESRDAAYYAGKIAAAKFFANTFLTLSPAKAKAIKDADRSAVDIPEVSFASA
jgi:alkylation response protein AidB-like acyl-CoA dehydrogenase